MISVFFAEGLWGYEMLSQYMYKVLSRSSTFCKVIPLLFEGIWKLFEDMVQPTLQLCRFASVEIYPDAMDT